MIEQLSHVPAIGWDFDGTLIDHPNSSLIHEFILDHPDKHHYIVTFRTHGLQNTMFREMQKHYPDAPGEEAFAGTRNISDIAWEHFNHLNQLRVVNRLTGPLRPWEEYYVEWKGMICHQLNLPVLVDDLEALVLPGCEKYGIKYLHPDEL